MHTYREYSSASLRIWRLASLRSNASSGLLTSVATVEFVNNMSSTHALTRAVTEVDLAHKPASPANDDSLGGGGP